MKTPIPAFDFKRDPLARHWNQPDHNTFIWFHDCVIVTPTQIKELHAYDSSIPTGCYPGKCWLRNDAQKGALLMWYGYGKDADHCSINYRQLLIKKPARLVAQDLLSIV